MGDRLDELEDEVIGGLLDDWVDVYDKGQQVYDTFPAEIRAWVDEHGHRVESLVAVVALMQPDVRVICRSLVVDARAARLSQGDVMMEANESGPSRGRGEMGRVEDRVTAIEARLDRIEDLVRELIALDDSEPAQPATPPDGAAGPRSG